MYLLKNQNLPIGLDISDLSIKFIQLKALRDRIKIQAIGSIPLAEGIVQNGEIKDQDKFKTTLLKLLAKPKLGSINTNEVVCCLPDAHSFVKLIDVAKSPNPISHVIASEIEKHVPLASDDLYFDWQVMNEHSAGFDILFGAAPRAIVNQYIEILKQAKLSPQAIEIESAAICRALLSEESKKYNGSFNKNYCIIDIGAMRTSLTVYSKNTIALSVSLPISNNEITKKISKKLEISIEQAEKAKIVCGFDKNRAHGIVHEILSDMIKTLNHKLSETIDFYNNHYPDRGPISQIILCGGGANIKNIGKTINELTSIDTLLGNIFINLKGFDQKHLSILDETFNYNSKDKNSRAAKSISIKQNSSLAYATAMGLALRDLFTAQL